MICWRSVPGAMPTLDRLFTSSGPVVWNCLPMESISSSTSLSLGSMLSFCLSETDFTSDSSSLSSISARRASRSSAGRVSAVG